MATEFLGTIYEIMTTRLSTLVDKMTQMTVAQQQSVKKYSKSSDQFRIGKLTPTETFGEGSLSRLKYKLFITGSVKIKATYIIKNISATGTTGIGTGNIKKNGTVALTTNITADKSLTAIESEYTTEVIPDDVIEVFLKANSTIAENANIVKVEICFDDVTETYGYEL